MRTLLTTCPACDERLSITRYECRNCGTTVDGRFEPGRLFRLTPEQLEFVEVFIRCEGKLNRMERELGMSYPTLRSRLTDVIRQMGFEVGPESAALSEEERHQILDDLATGKISSEEAMSLLAGE